MKFININVSNILIGNSKVHTTGPGNAIPLATATGYNGRDLAYYGTLPASEFINGDALTTAFNVHAGTRIEAATNCDWMKFKYEDKYLFIPMKTYRYMLTWADLYNLGLVYGTDDFGLANSGSNVNQYKTIRIGEHEFIVRLIEGSRRGDAAITGYHATNTTVAIASRGSEWNELMYRVAAIRPSEVTEPFANFTNNELCVGEGGSTAGTYTLTKSDQGAARIVRGWDGVGYLSTNYQATSNGVWMGWRPVLELIQK